MIVALAPGTRLGVYGSPREGAPEGKGGGEYLKVLRTPRTVDRDGEAETWHTTNGSN